MRGWGAIAGALMGAFFAAAPAAPAADPPVPDHDPFYRPPASLASFAPGAIIRSRQVDVSIGPTPVSALGATAYQLLYRTNEPSGAATANATTIVVPGTPPPAGGRELVSLQDAEDSLTTHCAPSYQLRVGERDNQDMLAEFALTAPSMLATNRALVIPDVYGPRSEFLVKATEAHAVLDSIRAVERFPAAQLDGVRTPVALAGYSGGGHETTAAAELQPAYAPELHVVGAAAGGTPVGDREFFDRIDGAITNVTLATMLSLERADPRLGWSALLNDRGRAVTAAAAAGPACVDPVVSGTDHLRDLTTVADPLGVPRIARAIAANAIGTAAPRAPTYLYVSQHDELIPLANEDKLAARYCRMGATLDYERDPVDYAGPSDHLEAAVAGFFPKAISYLDDRFSGAPPPTTGPPGSAQPAPAGPAATRCAPRRTLRVTLRIPRDMRVSRIRVAVDGRVVRVLHRRARALRVRVPKAAGSSERLTVRITGRRHGHGRTVRIARTYRRCARRR